MPLVTTGKKWPVESAGTNRRSNLEERARELPSKYEHQEGAIDILEGHEMLLPFKGPSWGRRGCN